MTPQEFIGKAKYDKLTDFIISPDDQIIIDLSLNDFYGTKEDRIKLGEFITDSINEKLEREGK